MIYHFTPTMMANILKTQIITTFGKSVEVLEMSYIAGVKCNVCYMTQKFCSLVYIQEEWKHMSTQKYCTQMFIEVLYIITPKTEITHISMNWWVGKWNVVYHYNGILFFHDKEWIIDTCYNMSDPWKLDMWKNRDTKGTCCRACCSKESSHHHLHLAETKAEEWKDL